MGIGNYQKKRVSVLIPTFNRCEFLPECLKPLLEQLGPTDEIIIIDDGSTDATQDVLAGYIEEHLRVISTPNRGKAAALNTALTGARGEFIWIVDDDDIVSQNALDVLLNLFHQNPAADFVYGRHDRFRDSASGTNRTFLKTGYWRPCEDEDFFHVTLEDMFVHQPGMLIRRSLFNRVGPFDEDLHRSIDYEMALRLARYGKVAGSQEVVFHQRLHSGLRGASDQRFSSNRRKEVWISADKEIFQKLYSELPIGEYLPKTKTSIETHRIHYLKRATVMARKKLWTYALQDFEEAASMNNRSLSASERSIIRRATASKYGCEEVLEDKSISEGLSRLARGSSVGSEITLELAKSLNWQIKSSLMNFQIRKAHHLALTGMRWRRKAKH